MQTINDFWASVRCRRIAFLFLFSIVLCDLSTGQILVPEPDFCKTCTGDLNLHLKSSFFMKNNEYFSPYTEGFTGLGVFMQPRLAYYFNTSTRIDAGIHLLKYAGESGLTQAIPIFSLRHQFTPDFSVVLGSINGTLHHQLEEPLFRSDTYYQNNVEYGVQFLYEPDWMRTDTWINWEDFIFVGDTIQEVFTIGNTTDIYLKNHGKFRVSIPLQFLYRHKGGQINLTDKPVYNFVNGATGIDLRYQFSERTFVALEPRFFLHSGPEYDERIGNLSHFSNGNARYYKVRFEAQPFYGMLGYWTSYRFIAPHGEYLFLNIAEFDQDFHVDNRHMVVGKIGFKHDIDKTMSFQAGFDGYYDLDTRQLEYSYGLYFLINHDFFLKKLKEE